MRIEAACGSHCGRIRRNNEDNFCFGGKILNVKDNTVAVHLSFQKKPEYGEHFAVFDGMGGENFGEVASYAAAREMSEAKLTWKDRFRPFETYLPNMVMKLNQAVLDAKAEMMTSRMGTTMVSLHLHRGDAYVCNVGDSRAYCFRNGELLQLTKDHVESRPRRSGGKAPLTQHLGIDPEDMLIEPHIMKQKHQVGDMYLLCSDGVTDMLTNCEITEIMQNSSDSVCCVEGLVEAALEHGGRDNITAIVCRIT